MKSVSSKSIVTSLLQGYVEYFVDCKLEGSLVIEGASEDNPLILENLGLSDSELYGRIRIRNVIFNGSVNFTDTVLMGNDIRVELDTVTVKGDLTFPDNIMGHMVSCRNLKVIGVTKYNKPS